ncbi:DUF7281 domain-containing protein [Microscilla marina]|uniref:DUF7281 domain-containing protein n=1 Tax=Microscilla marina ATCC 23134 TaxID=313606 RepID=A1ZRT5_MICM2|nr:hypothetical protein [Microscilla marina]EAY26990.1 hypothetical protein M23134_03642 [Microscilla marina ATCC 23134]
MSLKLATAKKLLVLIEGQTVPASSLKGALVERLINEGILSRRGRVRQTIQLMNPAALQTFLKNQYAIASLTHFIAVAEGEATTRAELVEASGDSKLRSVRTFQGFLVNSYAPIKAVFKGENMTIQPTEGTFTFIYDFEEFVPDKNVTIVGVENAENFRHLKEQAYLFQGITPLFVSRYPQNQSKDLMKWLQSIPNNYLHFGDFDLAGVGIYLHEYKANLGERARFFIPNNLESLLSAHGSRERYNKQKENFDTQLVTEAPLLDLIQCIHKARKGLDQEVFIRL